MLPYACSAPYRPPIIVSLPGDVGSFDGRQPDRCVRAPSIPSSGRIGSRRTRDDGDRRLYSPPVDLRSQLNVVRDHAKVVIACVVVALALAIAATALLPKTYE